MAEEGRNISNEIVDAILEKPVPFTIGDGRFFFLFQPSLGVGLLAGQLLAELTLDPQLAAINKAAEMLRVCIAQRDIVLRVLALHTFSRRSDVLREDKMQERIKELDVLQPDELATLVSYVLAWDERQERFIKHFKLDRERRTREKIFDYKKKKGGSLNFGGRSLYGTVLDAACERYGWELGYVLWGVSSLNLNMMLADSVQSIYLSKDEAKEAHVSTDGIYLDANNINDLREIQRQIKGK